MKGTDKSEALSNFFEAISQDGRISITHIGIYAALLQYRLINGFTNPIQVFSRQIMQLAKISAPITYHRCIRELNDYGYIRYVPSFNRREASRIYFLDKPG